MPFLRSDVGESSTVMFYDNMGVIHHAMGKHNMACHYFQKALKEDIAITSTNKKENGENQQKFSTKTLNIYFRGEALIHFRWL